MDLYSPSIRRDLYTCQLLGFTPRAFVDFFYNMLSKEIREAVTEIQSQLETGQIIKDIPENEIKKGNEKLKRVCEGNLAKNVDRLELYLENNIFRIPENVTLPNDKVQEQHVSTKDYEAELDAKINEAENKIKASFYSRLDMQNELQSIDNLKKQALQVLEKMKMCSDSCNLLNDDHMKSLCQNGRLCIDEVNNFLSLKTSCQEDLAEDQSTTPRPLKKQRKS